MAGYHFYSKSNNAINAEYGLKFPKTEFKRLTGIDPSDWIESCEWHHTSKLYNVTEYYSVIELVAELIKLSDEKPFNKLRKKEIYRLICKTVDEVVEYLDEDDFDESTNEFIKVMNADHLKFIELEKREERLEKRRQAKRKKGWIDAREAEKGALELESSKSSMEEARKKYYELKEAYPKSKRRSTRYQRMRSAWWSAAQKHEKIVQEQALVIYNKIRRTNLGGKKLINYKLDTWRW